MYQPAEENPCMNAAGDTSREVTEDSKQFNVVVFLVDLEDPDTSEWPNAIKSNECNKWLECAKVEIDSLREMNVFKLILCRDIPTNCSVLRGKFACHLKCNEAGNPVHHKVRWVAKGFQQV